MGIGYKILASHPSARPTPAPPLPLPLPYPLAPVINCFYGPEP